MAARIDLEIVKRFIDTVLGDAGRAAKELDEAKKEARKKALDALGFTPSEETAKWLREALEAAKLLSEEAAKGYAGAGYVAALLYYRLDTPGLVGAGGGMFKPVFEVGLTVDPVLGLPYYPGSGLKGAVRAYAEGLLGEEAASCIFGEAGKEAAAGAVVFGDMLPVGCARDSCSVYRGLVVTPHYHEGGEPVQYEIDAEPVPVQHVGIEEGLVFALPVAVNPARAAECLRRIRESSACENPQGLLGIVCKAGPIAGDAAKLLLALVMKIVDAALGAGIAARSTKGYNVFSPEEAPGAGKFTLAGYRYVEPEEGRGGQQKQGGRGGGGPDRPQGRRGQGRGHWQPRRQQQWRRYY